MNPNVLKRQILSVLSPALLIATVISGTAEVSHAAAGYDELLILFDDWRDFEQPPMRDGAPDYTAERFAAAYQDLPDYQARLGAIDPNGWPIEQQVDWHLIRAEMNGFDFNHRVLKPWQRDPTFYQSVWMSESDTPAHEGPSHHALLEFWTYELPLSSDEEARLIGELRVIPPLLEQARGNLSGNARDLWVSGIKKIRDQGTSLDTILEAVGEGASGELKEALVAAKEATSALAIWLESQAPSKTGPSGIGKDNYTWYLRNVHYVLLSWGGGGQSAETGIGPGLGVVKA